MPENTHLWPQGCRLLLTRDNAQGRFIALACAQNIPNLHILVEESLEGSLHKILLQVRRHRRRGGWMFAAWKTLELPALALWEGLSQRRLSRVLQAPKFFPEGVPLRRVASVNSPECLEWVKNFSHQSAMVYGTSILKSPLIEALHKVANIHMGLVPKYRGAKSEFWALARQDEGQIGFSLHQLVLKLDAGALLLQQKVVPTNLSPTQCRADSLSELVKSLPEVWRSFELGECKALEQKGDVGYFSTPSLGDRLRLALRTGHWL